MIFRGLMKNLKGFLYFLRLPLIMIIILLISGYLILIANGYKINFQAKKIQKTGMIYLKSLPREVTIYLNGQEKANHTPARFSDLSPGRYDIEINKDNYHHWQKTLIVEPGLVSVEDSVVLFLNKPEFLDITEEEKKDFKKLPNKLLNTDLQIRDSSEIWIRSANGENDFLVTRLSQPIKKVAYYSDKKHLLFQVEKEIKVIDLDGSNNIKLVEFSSEDPTEFFVDDKGEILFYQDGEEIKKARIR